MQLAHLNLSVALFIVATLIEGACEPFCVEMLMAMDFSTRAKAEGFAITVKGVATLAFLYFDLQLLAYGIAQIFYSVALLW